MLGYLGFGKCCGSWVACPACPAYLEAAVAGDPEYKVGQTRDHPKDSQVGQQAQEEQLTPLLNPLLVALLLTPRQVLLQTQALHYRTFIVVIIHMRS